MTAQNVNSYVKTLTKDEMQLLLDILNEKSWDISSAPYCLFKASKEKTTVAAYLSGKLVVQGKGTQDLVEFVIEPMILRDKYIDELASEDARRAEKDAEVFEPHAGIDESGKGDFFGPLVVASAFVATKDEASKLEDAGVRDSKLIKDDRKILLIASEIKRILGGRVSVVVMGPDAYNRLYDSFANLNKLLAWGHARALENLLGKAPECSTAISDKFGDERFIKNALLEKGKTVNLIQRTKAESDIAVAASSILARAEFVRRMKSLGELAGMTLPKGAGTLVDEAAHSLVERLGADELAKYSKTHFRTYAKILGLEVPEKKPWVKRK